MMAQESRLTSLGPFESLRAREFARLDQTGTTYLDYTGAALYPASLVTAQHKALQEQVLGNPHSLNPASVAAAEAVDHARQRILRFFNADSSEYCAVLTANASAAIKLVAESFPFDERSRVALTVDNHNSVNGIREYAYRAGAKVHYLPVDNSLGLKPDTLQPAGEGQHLFAYPAQSNFSGVLQPLYLVSTAQQAGYRVLLDAAAYVPSHRLDLSTLNPDFVCVSFYKMFGFPTGIGALIVRRKALAQLRRPWFAGGTVAFASTQNPDLHRLVNDEHAFEDGSPNFTSAEAVVRGLDYLDDIGMEAIQSHVGVLTRQWTARARALRHRNGAPRLRFYGGEDQSYGGCRAFNVLDAGGQVVSYERVERAAAEAGLALRGGCFCNPGCAEAAFRFSAATTRRCLGSTSDHFSPQKLARCLGTTEVGALRVSLGPANNEPDIDRLVEFLKTAM
ncbi:MAG: aminotransferase class V-fold PLP-dependent enzyme [Pseudomonadota bacterium]